jgi:hypothetical protein
MIIYLVVQVILSFLTPHSSLLTPIILLSVRQKVLPDNMEIHKLPPLLK